MIRAALVAVALLCAGAAHAQDSYSSLNTPPSAEDMQALLAQIPVPADSMPPPEQIGGGVGSQMRYARQDHTHPRITRAATVVTNAAGLWSISWDEPLTATPAILPIAINSGNQAIVCNAVTRTLNGATGRCWQAMSPAVISIAVATNPLPVVGAGISVQVFAIPQTQ